MKIIPLQKNPTQYTCNSYLILGDWNKLDDFNTLIDVGMDDFIIDEINSINTGVGKRSIDQIIITHNHFDHSGGLKKLIKLYDPKIYAFDVFQKGVLRLKHGDVIKAGDRYFDILHTDQHSSDSICMLCKHDGVLFSGDTPIVLSGTDGTYTQSYKELLKFLVQMNVKVIYPGHGPLIEGDITKMLHQSLANSRRQAVKAD